MFSRYPDQASSRRVLALAVALLLVFGMAMAMFQAAFMAVVGIGLALVLLVAAVFCGHSKFAAVERVLGRVFAGW